jgi:predicted Zn finger-like uncharacterized protein
MPAAIARNLAMLIVCPSCSTSYDVGASSLGKNGRSVRCLRCRTVWFAAAVGERRPAVAAPEPAGSVDAPDFQPPDLGADDDAAFDAMENDLASFSVNQQFEDFESQEFPVRIEPIDDIEAREIGPAAAASASGAQARPIEISDAPSLVPSDEEPSAAAAKEIGAPIAEAVPQPSFPRPSFLPSSFSLPSWARVRALSRPSLTTIIVALAATLAFILFWRVDLVRLFPQTASLFSQIGLPVNIRGLVIDDLKMSRDLDSEALVIDGVVTNVTGKVLAVPRLRLALRDAGGAEITTWILVPQRSSLKPGESQAFRTQTVAPPAEAHDVLVRFFTRRDLGRL